MRITVNVFFKSITIRNKHLIPDKGPLMVLANHPSTFMDPIVIATTLNRKVYFLAKGELFKSKFAKWMLPKLNMIPVYRKQDDPSQMSKNDETFKKCFEHLEKGGAILMFPEGISITERKLKPIKTGAARIVLGTEARNNFQLNVKVVNIGLSYVDPHHFNRDLFINIYEPISAEVYKEEYAADPYTAAQNLTKKISTQLETLVIGIDDAKTDELVKNIETLYKYKLSKQQGLDKDDKEGDFNITKKIIDTVNYFKITQPQRVAVIQKKIKEYTLKLNHLNLKDEDISRQESESFLLGNLKSLLILLIGLPIYAYGFINNVLPFEIPAFIAKKISKTKEFVGAIGMVLGFFFFLIFYTVQILFVWKAFHIPWLTFAYEFSLPLSELFAYWYHYTWIRIKTKWQLIMLFYKKSTFISNLINEREQLIAEFDKAKNEYAFSII